MTISQAVLAHLYLYSLLLGVVFGAIYDALRITRVFLGVHYSRRTAKRLQQMTFPLLPPRKKRRENKALGIVVFFEDLLFCLFVGVALILLFYEINNGKIRYLSFLCAGAGFLLYRATLGRLVMLFSEVIAFAVALCVRYVLFFLLFPVKWLGRIFKRRIMRLRARAAAGRQQKKRRRYTAAQIGRSERDACGLIPEQIHKEVLNKPKKGKQIGKGKKKAIQPHDSDARAVGGSRRHVGRNICK